jgi:UDP-GlcNAc:undecaprenyl-phosphate/decaprenyl-phosphate GlcNAc-1-phosphate transferase
VAAGIPDTVFVAAFAGAAALSLGLTPMVRRAALAFGALDMPDERKVHTTPVPRLGGMAIGLAMALAVLAALAASPALRAALFGGHGLVRWGAIGVALVAVLVAGAVDDVRGVPAGVKLALEIVAAALVVSITGVPGAAVVAPSTSPIALGAFGPPLAVLWIVALTNAVNMTDVVDGVAGGVGAICAAALGLTSLALGHVVATAVLLGLTGALVGFLPHNFRTRRIFLGDSGSLLVGFLLGVASLVGLERDGAWLAWPAVLAVSVPLAECGLTVTRRLLRALAVVRPGSARERFLLRRGRAGLFMPDRRHVPHRLREIGFAPWTALALLYCATLGTGALAVAAVRWPAVGPPAVLLAVAAVLYVAPRWLYEELRLFDRGAFLPLLETRVLHNRLVHVVYDGLAVAAAFLASRAIARAAPAGDAPLWAVTGSVIVATLAGFKLAGLYRGSYREAGLAETARALRAVVVGGVLGAGASFAVLGGPLAPAAVFLFLYFLLTLVVGARFSFRVLEHVYQRAQLAGRRVLIFGADRSGSQALAEMLSRPELGLHPVGFVDNDPASERADFQGYPVRAVHDGELTGLLRSLDVSDLVVPVGSLAPARLAALGELCRAQAVRLLHFGVRWDAGDERVSVRVPDANTAS